MNLINHPDEFREGTRIVMKLLRGKDGGLAKPDHHAEKIVTRSSSEWDEAVLKFADEASENERIYASADARDFNKALHLFKQRQLDADLYNEEAKQSFYIDVKNRFISCLAAPTSRATKLFLFDCDTNEEITAVANNPDVKANLIYWYMTKNGFHYVTRPFNATKVGVEKKTNAMVLVGY